MSDLDYEVDAFLASLKTQKRYAANTLESYALDLRDFVSGLPDNATLTDLNPNTAKAYLYSLNTLNLNPKSIARKLASLRSFCTFLTQTKKLKFNPFKDIKSPKIPDTLPDILSTEQIVAFLNNLKTDTPLAFRNRLLCELIFSTGLRVSELVSLVPDQLCFKRHQIRVIGKGNKERLTFFTPYLAKLLKTYLDTIRPKFTPKTHHLLLGQNGTPLTSRSVQRIIKNLGEAQAIPIPRTPHCLRHAFATSLYAGGMSLKELKELLGHSAISTTEIYTRLSLKDLKAHFLKGHPRGALG